MTTLTSENKITPDYVLAQLQWRYATKVFDPTQKISDELWSQLEDMLVLSPSSYGLQPYKFIVVKNPETRKQLLPASYNQKKVVDASHLVVFAHRDNMAIEDVDRLINRIAQVRKVPIDSLKGLKDVMIGDLVNGPRKSISGVWASRQIYIALGQLLTAASMLGIDACPMEGINPPEYNRILKLENTGYSAVAACALGARSASDSYASLPKVRLEKKDLIETR